MITKEQLESWYNHKSNKESWIEEQENKREQWLLDLFLTENDVLEDDKGEFIMVESTEESEDSSGTPQLTGKMKKIYLPNEY